MKSKAVEIMGINKGAQHTLKPTQVRKDLTFTKREMLHLKFKFARLSKLQLLAQFGVACIVIEIMFL